MTVEEVTNEFDKLHVCYLALKVENRLRQRVRVPLVVSRTTITAPSTTPKATTPTTTAAGNTRERVNNAHHCYKCSGLGHYPRECPNLKTLAFVPDDADPTYDTEAEPELDEPGDELVYPDRGEALVIQRTQAGGSNLFMKKTDFQGIVKTSPYVYSCGCRRKRDCQ
ncbi:reverse transcriptase domain-containing protein [Artemisia annua]|uniref:Reverse transcriptase domain-containing protein n=1 Tax=Artemisia annua TaxID=35608 RepID=A0A2U1NDE1_ARTAN|nr:reverse transcriptase domain-containing protein [Artemisia annua]